MTGVTCRRFAVEWSRLTVYLLWQGYSYVQNVQSIFHSLVDDKGSVGNERFECDFRESTLLHYNVEQFARMLGGRK